MPKIRTNTYQNTPLIHRVWQPISFFVIVTLISLSGWVKLPENSQSKRISSTLINQSFFTATEYTALPKQYSNYLDQSLDPSVKSNSIINKITSKLDTKTSTNLSADVPKMGAPLTAADITNQATTVNGHRIEETPEGARILCHMQDLEGLLTEQGLILRSVDNGETGVMTVRAREIGRDKFRTAVSPGKVEIDGTAARLIQTNLIEEITTTSEGLRQDWIVLDRPEGTGHLTLDISVSGAVITSVEDTQVALTIVGGRKLVWRNLLVVDANHRSLPARFTIHQEGLRVEVNDISATYPIRIDPTFTDEDWVSMGGLLGANDSIRSMAVDASDRLIVGGYFTAIGNIATNYIALWDGNNWSALGTGMNSYVYSITVSGSDLYVGGEFTNAGGISANRIARWDGNSWSALGTGMNNFVNAVAVTDSYIYAGGGFTNAGGIGVNYIARWDGFSWTALGTGTNGAVNALAVSGANLFVGGGFTSAGGITVNRIAGWDGNNWSALGSGMNNTVHALAVSGSNLFAGGSFYTANGVVVSKIARWDGSNWSALGSGVDNDVNALVISGSEVFAGGRFSTAGGVNAKRIARWDGTKWYALGSGLNNGVNNTILTLAASGNDIYTGGYFSTAGGISVNRIAHWDGSNWSKLGSGKNVYVDSLITSGNEVYAGGGFTNSSGIAVNNFAKWDGANWAMTGSGTDGYITALAESGNAVFAGGWFTTAGSINANYIARWYDTYWATLGSGMNGPVNALVLSGGILYVGGSFTTAGGITVNRIAKWNGFTWSPLGSGMNGTINAIAVSGSDLYVGGNFTTAGGITANNIAKWNGFAWSALGSGINYKVNALAVSGSIVYAAGDFATAGGITVNNIARWDGANWSALGTGTNGPINALAISGSDLYVGGDFETAGSISVNRIALWNGSNWSSLGSGTNDIVYDLAVYGSSLYASGNFTIAGGKAGKIARWAAPIEVTYEPNGGIGSTPPATKRLSTSLTLSDGSEFSRSGYVMTGWNTSAIGTGTNYSLGASYADHVALTLYAQWALAYAVSYNANGGSGVMAEQTKIHDINITLKANTFTKTGYTFAGWNTQANGLGTNYGDIATYSNNEAITLYAQWVNTYAVSFSANGGNGIMLDQIKNYGVDLVLNTNVFTRTGFTFTGWNTQTDGQGITYADGAIYFNNSPILLYAMWQPVVQLENNNDKQCGLGSGFGTSLLLVLLSIIRLRRRV